MSEYLGQSRFRHDQPLRAGVLLVNLGTPDAPRPRALRRYLKEFLSDPRVVELPRPVWWLILNLVILNLRPRRSAEAYRKIWTEHGSPLLMHTQRLAGRVLEQVDARSPQQPLVKFAMRYGEPSIPAAMREMHEAQLHRLLVLPLYPQYSGSTTGSTFDAVSHELQSWRWVPELRFVGGYHDHELYIQALADKVRRYWDEHHRGELLLMSFHGVPRRYLLKGDPYHCQCHATARLLAAKLELREDQWQVVFQSRFGREPWLQPYCDETLKSLPGRGVRSVDLVCPGFAVDCLETLEEIAMQNRELFEQAGGESFQYIPCLNDDEAHAELMLKLVEEHSAGWDEFAKPVIPSALEQRQARALALGAER
ncbi:MAG TPA: ferrochelatase [Arenicellales bacterium]|nr:ferrochelatase [Arenicellales bacterium]